MAADSEQNANFPAGGPAAQGVIDPGVLPGPDDGLSRDAPTAAQRLRAFEDKHFGADAVRIRDQIEKGSGSPFQMAKPAIREQHAALEKLIEAEAKLAAAHTALIQADTEYEAARAATEPKADNPRLSRLGPTVEEYVAAGYRASNYPPGGYDSRSTREEIDAAIAKQEADAAASK